MAIEVKYTHDEASFFVIEKEDVDKLRAFSNKLGGGDRMDDMQRRDMGHKIWLIINKIVQNEVH